MRNGKCPHFFVALSSLLSLEAQRIIPFIRTNQRTCPNLWKSSLREVTFRTSYFHDTPLYGFEALKMSLSDAPRALTQAAEHVNFIPLYDFAVGLESMALMELDRGVLGRRR